MLVVACVAIIVVGPKDLPQMLRSVGKTIRKVRNMAGDFQRQFNDALKESELSELKDDITGSQTFAPIADAKKAMEDFKKNVDNSVFDVKDDIETDIAAVDTPAASTKKTSGKTPAKAKAKPKAKPAAKAAATKRVAAKTVAAKPAARKPAAKKATPRKKVAASKSSPVRKSAAKAKSKDATA